MGVPFEVEGAENGNEAVRIGEWQDKGAAQLNTLNTPFVLIWNAEPTNLVRSMEVRGDWVQDPV